MPGIFDLLGQSPLMSTADAAFGARYNFCPICHKAAKKIGVNIGRINFVLTKVANSFGSTCFGP